MSTAQTTLDKAALCDSLLPLVRAGAEALRPLAGLSRPPDPGPLSRRLIQLALRGARDLLADEPAPLDVPRNLLPARIGNAPAAAELLLTLRAAEAALLAFRARYFGWHQEFGRSAWHIDGADGVEAAGALLGRVETAPPPGRRNTGEMRSKIAIRIHEILDERDAALAQVRSLTSEVEALRAAQV